MDLRAWDGEHPHMDVRYVVVMLLVGVALLAQPGYQTYMHYQEQPTVTTEGEVLTADHQRANEKTYFVLDVRYRYEYDGETYESEDVFRGSDSAELYADRQEVDAVLDKYDLDSSSTVTVHLREDDPSESYLIEKDGPTIPDVNRFLLVPGVIVLLAGVLGLVDSIRERRESGQTSR